MGETWTKHTFANTNSKCSEGSAKCSTKCILAKGAKHRLQESVKALNLTRLPVASRDWHCVPFSPPGFVRPTHPTFATSLLDIVSVSGVLIYTSNDALTV